MSTQPDQKSTKVTHTPTPWTTDKHGYCVFAHAGQMMVCEIRGWGYLAGFEQRPQDEAIAIQEANAEFIVRACNSHEALVSALQYARSVIQGHAEDHCNGCKQTLSMLDAALAKASQGHGDDLEV